MGSWIGIVRVKFIENQCSIKHEEQEYLQTQFNAFTGYLMKWLICHNVTMCTITF